MANRPHTPAACINEHIRVTYKNTKKSTSSKYEAVLININGILRDNGLELNPRNIGEDDIRFLLEHWEGKAISTRNWYLHILNRYLKYYGNTVIEDMEINLGYDDRPNVDWLSDEECIRLMQAPKTPLEEVVIHLELCMGLRVSEVVKLRVGDVHFSDDPRKRSISVCGKGRGDGKWRTIPFHPDSERILRMWLEERTEMIQRIRAYNPSWPVPDNLLIWCHYVDKPTGGPYTERGHSLDRAVIHKVRDRLDMDFSNHTLRRTFGRNLYHADTPIETISKLYGHEDIQTTLRYIGVNLDDMSDALGKMYAHQLVMTQRLGRSG